MTRIRIDIYILLFSFVLMTGVSDVMAQNESQPGDDESSYETLDHLTPEQSARLNQALDAAVESAMQEIQGPPPLCLDNGVDGEYVRYLKSIDYNKSEKRPSYIPNHWPYDGKKYWQTCTTDKEGRIITVRLYGDGTVLDGDKPTTPLDEVLKRLAPLKYVREATITENFAHRPPTPFTDDGLQYLAGWQNLEKLEVQTIALTGKAFLQLAEKNSLKQLREISVSVTNDADAVLEALQGCSKLEAVRLNEIGLTDHGLSFIAYLENLTELEFSRNQLTGQGMRHLVGLKSLRSISLDEMLIGDEGLKHLSLLPDLRRLYIGDDNSITGAGLAEICKATTLETLALTGTQIHSDDCAHLLKLTSLTYLDLRNTPITEKAFSHIRQMKGLKNLSINGCPVRKQAVRQLRKDMPWCDISF